MTDTTVGPLYGADVADRLAAPCLELPAGEEHKRWPSVERIARWLLAHEAERSAMLVAVGGGVVTDLVGFAAAVTLRGIGWAAIPTTLLAMVDAALGGKTGIDLDEGKNLIGAFWPPRAIVADILALATLDQRQLHAGLAEVVKAAMIAPSSLEHVLDSHLAPVAAGDPLQALELVVGCARVKSDVVASTSAKPGRGRRSTSATPSPTGSRARPPTRASSTGRRWRGGCWRSCGSPATGGCSPPPRHSRGRTASTPSPRSRASRTLSWDDVAPYVARDKKREGGRVGWVLPRLGGVVLDVPVSGVEAATVYAELQALPPEGPFSALF